LANKAVGDADFDPGATASSGLPVSYASGNAAVATIIGSNIHIIAVGTSAITATQAGNTNYNAATPVTQTLTVGVVPLSVASTALSVNNYTVSFTDASSGGKAPLIISVNWQDGTVSTGNAGSTFTHTYSAASKYNIVHTVADSALNPSYASEFIPVTVSSDTTTRRSITVNVTDSDNGPIKGVIVNLKKQTPNGWVEIGYGFTDANGSKTFSMLKENKNYQIVVYKSAIDFNGGKAFKQPKVKTAAFTLTVDATVNIQQGTPATNGPSAQPWKGDNGDAPSIIIIP
jgi:5-hydroxyisourate hydrolase-like protein (transthyretin family)